MNYRICARLVIWGAATHDIVTLVQLAPLAGDDDPIEIHHLFPKNWLQKNQVGSLGAYLDASRKAGEDRVNCAANLLPIKKSVNQSWKDKQPGQMLKENGVTWDTHGDILKKAFIDEHAFEAFVDAKPDSFQRFVEGRAEVLAKHVAKLLRVNAG